MIPFVAPDRQNRGLAPALTPKTNEWLSAPDDAALRAEREALEDALARTCGYTHAVAVATGPLALQTALRALRLTAASEVIVTSPLAAEAALSQNLTVVALDPSTPLSIEECSIRLSPHTRALVVSAPFGEQANLPGLKKLCSTRGIYLLEESSLGLPNHRPHGATVSFSPRSPLSLPGYGGVVLTDDPIFASRAREARTLWQGDISPWAASLIRTKLAKLPGWLSLRRSIAQWYLSAFQGEFARGRLGLPLWPTDPTTHVWDQFPITTAHAPQLREALMREGVETTVPFPNKPFLALPLYPELSGKEVNFVVERLQSCLNRYTTSSSISR